MAINLYLVRHGQTMFNKEHRMQGSCDSALTSLGIKQVEALRDYFTENGVAFDRAYCSTQERASDTLEIITGPEMEYTRLKELKEKNYGIFEGRSVLWWPFSKIASSSVENNRDVFDRMELGMNLVLRDAQDGDNILVVGHGDSMSRYIFEKTGTRKFHGFQNGSYALLQSNGHEVDYVKSGWPIKDKIVSELKNE